MGAFTNEDGEYTILNVPPGRYILRAAMVGYKSMEVQDLLVTVGVATTQNFQLERWTTGVITGSVTDRATDEPLDKVNVFLFNPDGTATTIGTFTNEQGEFTIINIPAGTYVVRAVLPGYKTMEVTAVKVAAGITTTINFELERMR
jgi:hypothetical protein